MGAILRRLELAGDITEINFKLVWLQWKAFDKWTGHTYILRAIRVTGCLNYSISDEESATTARLSVIKRGAREEPKFAVDLISREG
jgi:hypothetical protein